jgi:hypothetical protein
MTAGAVGTHPRGPKPVMIDPGWCELNHAGNNWREFQIRLPREATLVDLNENRDMWKLLQGSGNALRARDSVRVIAFDESWMTEAIVTEATSVHVSLAITKRVDLTSRHDRLPQDENFRVIWVGNGFAIERKRDKMRVSQIVQTAAEAERELSRKYSRPTT